VAEAIIEIKKGQVSMCDILDGFFKIENSGVGNSYPKDIQNHLFDLILSICSDLQYALDGWSIVKYHDYASFSKNMRCVFDSGHDEETCLKCILR